MRTILVATDFSSAALNAAEYAVEMALSINAGLFLLHIYGIPVTYTDTPVPVINEEGLRMDAEKEMLSLKELLRRKTNGKLKIETEVRLGIFISELNVVCDRVQPYMIIMGSQGTTAMERLLAGSHTIKTLKNLEWPLLTVPEGRIFSPIKKIGLACDLNNVHYSVPTDEIKTLVKDFNAELHILNIGKENDYNADAVFEASMLLRMLSELKPVTDFITSENTDEGIIEFAEKNNIDLLIVLPKRHSFFDKIIHKSHSRQLVLHCLVPVMALHQ